jgi:hypothetical protein
MRPANHSLVKLQQFTKSGVVVRTAWSADRAQNPLNDSSSPGLTDFHYFHAMFLAAHKKIVLADLADLQSSGARVD